MPNHITSGMARLGRLAKETVARATTARDRAERENVEAMRDQSDQPGSGVRIGIRPVPEHTSEPTGRPRPVKGGIVEVEMDVVSQQVSAGYVDPETKEGTRQNGRR